MENALSQPRVFAARAGDRQAAPQTRGDRYFTLDQHWYFITREGVTMGPYPSRTEAVKATHTYIRFIRNVKGPFKSLLKRQSGSRGFR